MLNLYSEGKTVYRKELISEVFSRSFPNQCNCSRCFYLLVGWWVDWLVQHIFSSLVQWHLSPWQSFRWDYEGQVDGHQTWVEFQIFHSTQFLRPHKRVLNSLRLTLKRHSTGKLYFCVLLMLFDPKSQHLPTHITSALFCFSGPLSFRVVCCFMAFLCIRPTSSCIFSFK